MLENKKPALATRGGRNERGQANVSISYSTTCDVLRQLAEFAESRAHVCAHPRARERFARLALFLKIFAARGGVR